MTQTQLSPKQRKAIAALVESGEVSSAADAANVSRTTLYSWLRQPAFQKALRDAEAEALKHLSRQLVTLGKRASGVLAEMLSDADVHPSTRLRAADIVLGRLLQLRELIDLESRVAELESRMGDANHDTD